MRSNGVASGRFLTWGVGLALIAAGLSCQRAAPPRLTQAEADRIVSVYEQARNTPDLDLLDGIYDTAVVIHDCSAPEEIRGLAALKTYYQASHAGLPDFRIALDETLISGESLVLTWTITATHKGTLRGLPPSGRSIRFSGVAIDRVANGKIVDEWVYFNVLDLMQQLGFTLAPPAPPATS